MMSKPEMEVTVDQINVNQGDSALICLIKDKKLEKAVLVDAGKETPGKARVLPFLKKKQAELKHQFNLSDFNLQLDAIVVTHYDEDHLGGMVSLLEDKDFTPFLKKIPSKTLFYDPGKYEDKIKPTSDLPDEVGTKLFKNYKKLIEKNKDIIHITSFDVADDTILGHELFWDEAIDLTGGFVKGMTNLDKKNVRYQDNPALLCVAVNLKAPDAKNNLAGFSPMVGIVVSGGSSDGTSPKNQRSVALILVSAQKEILHYLPGDLGEKIEIKIVEWLKDYGDRFTAMKFSHHGGKNSTPIKLLTQFSPQIGVISAGKNEGYRHPALELLLYIADLNRSFPMKLKAPMLVVATNNPYYLQNQALFEKVVDNFDFAAMEKLIQSPSIKIILEYFKIYKSPPSLKDKADAIEKAFTNIKIMWGGLTQYYSQYSKLSPLELEDDAFPVEDGQPPLISTITTQHLLTSISSTPIVLDGPADNTEFKTNKRKRIIRLSSAGLADQKVAYRIGGSNLPSEIKSDVRLSKNCDLDVFVNNLKSMCLTLMMAQAPDPSAPKLSGIIVDTVMGNQPLDFFGTWLKQTLAMVVTLEMSRNYKDDTLVVNAADMSMSAVWDSTPLADHEESKVSNLSGHLQDGTFTFQSEKMPTTLGTMSQFAGFSSPTSELLDLLTNLLGVDIKPSSQINIVFDPWYGWNYFTRLTLTSIFTNQLKLGPPQSPIIVLSNPILVFNNQFSPRTINSEAKPIDDIVEDIFFRYSASIGASLTIGSLPSIAVTLLMQSNGWSKVTFQPAAGTVAAILKDILQACGEKDPSIIQNFADHFGFSLPDIKSVTLTFAKLEFISVEIAVQLQIFNKLLLDVYCAFPDKKLWGGLSVQAPSTLADSPRPLTLSSSHCLETKLATKDLRVAATTDDDNSDDDSDYDISNMSLQSLLAEHKIGALDDKVGSLRLGGIYFAADFAASSYSLEAKLGSASSQPSQTVWQFCDEIRLVDIDIKLGKEKDKEPTFSMEASLSLGSLDDPADVTLITIGGQYNQGWQFGASISKISLYQLFDLFPKDDGIREGLTELFPNISLDNIQLTLNATSKTFSFSGQLNILGLPKTQLNFVLFGGGSEPKRFLFSLEMPCLSLFDNIAFLKSIPSPLKSVQFIAASKQPLLSTDDLSSFSNLSVNKDQIKPGVALVFAINGISDPIWLQLYASKKPVPLLRSTNRSLILLNDEVKEEKSDSQASPVAVIWKKIDSSLGILTLNRIGLGYNQQRLHLLFDSTLQLGMLEFKLLGLGINFLINKPTEISFELNGLGLEYESPAFSLAGDFLRVLTPPEERFQGDIVMKVPAFSIGALGSYSKDNQNNTSVFVFARLNKALGGPPFLYVTGLSAGFGYNQYLRIPTMTEVFKFPLVKGAVTINPAPLSSDDLTTTLQELFSPIDGSAPWLQSQKNVDWLALGIDATTFNLIGTRLLAVVEFGQEFQLAILGRSCLQLPPSNSDNIASDALAYVEMGLEALLKPAQGIFALTALLSANSFVLTRDCHLTGGFALNMWFKDQPDGARAGDFAVTLGGYHPSYKPRPWYPQVPRLGFNWQVSNKISIDGEAYFALTPSCVMAGGLLQALFKDGDLQAWFKAHGDFLIEWHPVHYEASIGVSVGASYRLNLLFTHVTISAEIGVDLELYGPPLGGEVNIDWYIISFSIHFGADKVQASPKTWEQFRQFLFKGTRTLINKIIIENGLLQQDKSDCWIVRPNEFSFSTESLIPATAITIDKIPITEEEKTPAPLYIKLMSDTNLNYPPNKHPTIVQIAEHTHQINISTPDNKPAKWQYQPKKRYLASALWGDPQAKKSSVMTSPDLLPSSCMVGVTIQPPAPIVGTSPGLLSIEKAFSNMQVDEGQMPLTLNTSIPESKGEVVSDSRTTIGSTIATLTTQQTRQQLTSSLQRCGLFPRGVALDTMTELAKTTKASLLESPLLTQKR